MKFGMEVKIHSNSNIYSFSVVRGFRSTVPQLRCALVRSGVVVHKCSAAVLVQCCSSC